MIRIGGLRRCSHLVTASQWPCGGGRRSGVQGEGSSEDVQGSGWLRNHLVIPEPWFGNPPPPPPPPEASGMPQWPRLYLLSRPQPSPFSAHYVPTKPEESLDATQSCPKCPSQICNDQHHEIDKPCKQRITILRSCMKLLSSSCTLRDEVKFLSELPKTVSVKFVQWL